jgi:Uma2 family endonuclease
VVEVLSDSTAEYDRGEKLDHYRQIASLQEILLVSHHEALIEIWRRDAAHNWAAEAVRSGPVRLPSVRCEFDLAELYRDLPRTAPGPLSGDRAS